MRKLNCGNFQGRGGVGGAGRGSRPDRQKTVWTPFVLSSTYFTVNRGVQWFYYREDNSFSKDPERVQYFPGGSNFFLGGGGGGGGVQMLISIETHMTCDFPGVRTPYPHSGSAHDLVIYFFFGGGDFFTIDFYYESGPFVIQNHYMSFTGMKQRTQRKQIFCPFIHPRSLDGVKTFFLKKVMLHIKLKGKKCRTSCK